MVNFMGRWCFRVVLVAVVGGFPNACYEDISVPQCETLADCPVGMGYTACEDGYCFSDPTGCITDSPIPADGCCAHVEGDMSADTDCSVVDDNLTMTNIAGPVIDNDYNVFVSGLRVIDQQQYVLLIRRTADGTVSFPVVAGPGLGALAPAIFNGQIVFVAHQAGVLGVYADDLVSKYSVASPVPVGGLVATGDGVESRAIVAWPTADGSVVLFDLLEEMALKFPIAKGVGEAGDAYAPTVSGRGWRMYVAWHSGVIAAVRIDGNPMGPTAVMKLGANVRCAPVEADGVLYVAEGQRIVAFEEDGGSFVEKWSYELSAPVAGGLLVDKNGHVIAVLTDGHVVELRDDGELASLVASGTMDEAVDNVYPMLCQSGRVVVYARDRRAVRTVRRVELGGNAQYMPGLWFELPVPGAGDLNAVSDTLYFATQSGRLGGRIIYDDLADGRFARAGANAEGTGRTATTNGE